MNNNINVKDYDAIRKECEEQRGHKYAGFCERYMEDAEEYLTSKLADVPIHDIKEIVGYLTYRMIICVNECLYERDRDWTNTMKRGSRKSSHNGVCCPEEGDIEK